MNASFQERLAQLRAVECESVDGVEYEERASDSLYAVGTALRFRDGTKLSAQFWRLTRAGKPLVSIFDHGQKYVPPARTPFSTGLAA